tara:strand:+ start:292 stop:429 length:138 start_codon:yes stop_codon:yes gene_type:complete
MKVNDIEQVQRVEKIKRQLEDIACSVMIFMLMYFGWWFAYLMEPM